MGDGELAEVEDARCKHRRRAAFGDAVGEVLQVADAARGDHRHRHRVADRTRQGKVEAFAGAVAIHAGEQDLAGAQGCDPPGPVNRVEAGGLASAMGEHFPAARPGALGVDGAHDALGAIAPRRVRDELRILDARGVDRHLVGAGVEQAADVVDRAHAAADRQRDEDLRRYIFDYRQDEIAPVAAGRDVEERKLVRALLVVAPRDFHRIAGIAEADEVHPLDHTPGGNVKAGNDALR